MSETQHARQEAASILHNWTLLLRLTMMWSFAALR